MSHDLTRRPQTGIPAQQSAASDLAYDARRAVSTGAGLGGWIARAQHGGAIKLTRKQTELLGALADLDRAAAGLAHARLERWRAIDLLDDADTVLDHDRDVRAQQRLQAEQALADARTEAEIKRLENEMRLQEARERHANFMRARSGGQPPVSYEPPANAPSSRGPAQREAAADLDQALQADEIRANVELRIQELIKASGGPENLTPELKKRFEEMRATAEKFIKESGFS